MLYPDTGSPFEDRAILRNAVYFTTPQRAYSAELILQQPLNITNRLLAFSVIRAFEEFMTATEDMIGWLFVLDEWRPGNVDSCLLLLLDRIMVGRKSRIGQKDYTEGRAVSMLSGLDGDGFRQLVHVPSDEELVDSGVPTERVEAIRRGMEVKLEGWVRITNRRAEQGRGWVRAFNKIKHHLLAFPTMEHDRDEVWLPTRIRYEQSRNRVALERAWLEVSPIEVRRLAADSIAAHAVLHDTLALILVTRYGENYEVPRWVQRAFETDYIWRR